LRESCCCAKIWHKENRNYKAHFLKMFVYLYTTNAVMPHPQHRTGKTVLGEYYWGGGPSYDPSTDPFYRRLITVLNNGVVHEST
jgi:hypothetical protein